MSPNSSSETPQTASSSDPIQCSPFYKDGAQAMPSGDTVEEGSLYMMDDEGGTVFQLFTTSSAAADAPAAGLPEGEIDVTKKFEATVSLTPMFDDKVKAKSFKSKSSSGTNRRAGLNGYKIIDLVQTGRQPLADDACQFKVAIKNQPGSFFAVYDIHDGNGQLTVVHTPGEPNTIPPSAPEYDAPQKVTQTKVLGMVYVQYEGTVYIGSMGKNTIEIIDPNDDFGPPQAS